MRQFFWLQQPARGLLLRQLLPLSLLIIGSAWLYGNDLVERELIRLNAQELIHVGNIASDMNHYLELIAGDLLYLAHSSVLQAALDNPQTANLQQLANDFVSFSRSKKSYDQIRWLDETGMEQVRVDFYSGTPRAVAVDALQNKKARYYFIDTFRLEPDQIYASPLDLNIEHGQIERPFKPMLRIGTPVVDSKGRRRGIVLLNFYGEKLLTHSHPESLPNHLSIVNRDGYWLQAPDAQNTWGFMLGNTEATLAKRYPAVWNAMRERDQGTLTDTSGAWIWKTIHPPPVGMTSSSGAERANAPSQETLLSDAYYWHVLSHLEPSIIDQIQQSSWLQVMTDLGLVLILFAFMIRRIGQSELKIIRVNADLAREVAARTQELNDRVAELERTRATLQYNEAQLYNAKRLAGLGHWRWDLRSGDLYWSEEIYGFFGRDPKLPPLDPLEAEKYYTAEGWNTLSSKVEKAITEGVPYQIDAELVRPDGRHRWLSFYGEAIRDSSGSTTVLQGAVQDITERKQTEQALYASEERLRHLIETSYDWIWELDAEGRFTYASPGIYRLLGYRPEEVIGRSAFDLMPSEEAVRVNRVFTEIAARQIPFKGLVNVNQHRDGRQMILETSGVPIFDRAGTVNGWRGNDRDITEQTRMTQELNDYRHHLEDLVEQRTAELQQARIAAEAATEAKSTFLANMSHEIRTPMNAILGLTYLLRHHQITPEQNKHLIQIDKSARHLLNIINDILDLSKIEAGRLQLDSRDFALADVLDHVYSLIMPSAQAKGLKVSSDSDHVPAWLHGDPTRLRQALLNFASNAVKFTQQGDIQLRVRVLEHLDEDLLLRFEVEDSGIGIEPERLPHMFLAFEQAQVSTARMFGGTGLGLAITHRLAGIMGGEVGAQSTPGKGSLFWFTARLARGEPIKRADTDMGLKAEAELRQRHANTRLLLAEDNLINQEVAIELLQTAGLTVDCAMNGKQALAMAQADNYALILMDVQMPEMDGLSATRAIRKLPHWVDKPILAMTANAFEEDHQACLEAGMDDFVAKPVEPANLYIRLLRWLPASADPSTALESQAASHNPVRHDPAKDNPDSGSAKQASPTAVGKMTPFEYLNGLPGIDTEKGLAFLSGKCDKYVQILAIFHTNHANDPARLAKLLDDGAAAEAASIAHALKGAAGTLGANDIYEVAINLERALRKNATDARCRVLIDELEQTLNALSLAFANT
jgi:two-component system sensor histidine kinase/response regulator